MSSHSSKKKSSSSKKGKEIAGYLSTEYTINLPTRSAPASSSREQKLFKYPEYDPDEIETEQSSGPAISSSSDEARVVRKFDYKSGQDIYVREKNTKKSREKKRTAKALKDSFQESTSGKMNEFAEFDNLIKFHYSYGPNYPLSPEVARLLLSFDTPQAHLGREIWSRIRPERRPLLAQFWVTIMEAFLDDSKPRGFKWAKYFSEPDSDYAVGLKKIKTEGREYFQRLVSERLLKYLKVSEIVTHESFRVWDNPLAHQEVMGNIQARIDAAKARLDLSYNGDMRRHDQYQRQYQKAVEKYQKIDKAFFEWLQDRGTLGAVIGNNCALKRILAGEDQLTENTNFGEYFSAYERCCDNSWLLRDTWNELGCQYDNLRDPMDQHDQSTTGSRKGKQKATTY